MTAADVEQLMADQLLSVQDARVIDHLSLLLVNPPKETRLAWDYGAQGASFSGFLVLRHAGSKTDIAYCEHGFGPRCPWGLVFSSDDPIPHTGMDSGWFKSFMEAYFESFAATELNIWRVQRREQGSPPSWISNEMSWEEAWARVMALRESDKTCRYDCWHSIQY